MKKIRVYPSYEELSKRFDFNHHTGEFTYKINVGTLIKKGYTTCGCIDSSGYRVIAINRIQYKAHRIAWILYHKDIDHLKDIDHINGNRSDNRIKNLRLASTQENSQNRIISKNNTFGHEGIRQRFDHKHKSKPYEASISFYGKRYFKCFLTVKEAIVWRKMKRKELWEFQPVSRNETIAGKLED